MITVSLVFNTTQKTEVGYCSQKRELGRKSNVGTNIAWAGGLSDKKDGTRVEKSCSGCRMNSSLVFYE